MMPDWEPEIRARLAALNLEAVRENEIAEEISQHLEDRFLELRARGASDEEASRSALAELSGDEFLARELRRVERPARSEPEVLGQTRGNMVEEFLADLKYGARMLRNNPGFTTVAVLTLALGIGANTAIFSVVNAVLLRPLPYAHPDRLVALWERDPGRGLERERVSGPDFMDWQEQNRVFDHIGFWNGPSEFNLVTADGAEKVTCAYASSGFFSVLGVQPLLGRVFLPEEDQPENNRVAVISGGLWRRCFGGDPKIIGRTLTVDSYGRRDYQIVGVMPEGFRFPEQCDLCLAYGWMGVRLDERRSAHWYQALARLKPGLRLEQARVEMNAIQGGIQKRNPDNMVGSQVAVVPLLEQTVGRNLRSALLVLCGVVASVLLIACANVANLLLARASARGKEIAIRLALGAGRGRVIRQLLTESLLLAFWGGGFGVISAFWSLRLLAGFGGSHIPRLLEARLDSRSLAFTLLVCLLTGLIFGLAPAWQFSQPDLNQSLNDGTRGSGGHPRRNRLRGLLVVSEMALCLVLLIGAGLMAKSFVRLTSINRGFKPDHLVAADLDFTISGFTGWVEPTATRPQVTLREIIARLKSRPDVRAAGAISDLSRQTSAVPSQTIALENRPAASPAESPVADFRGVTPDFFHVLGVPLLQGRDFEERDTFESPRVAIVNQTLARRYFPNENPVGKRLALAERKNPAQRDDPSQWIEIVAVAADVKRLNLGAETVPEIYVPYWQWPMPSPTLLVRTSGEAAPTTTAIRDVVKAANKNLPSPAIRTMDAILADTVAQPRFQTMLVELFGILALALAAVGIYGVMACVVAQRTREIGLRLALGAGKWNILSLVIGQGLKLALIGVTIGLAAALALTKAMASLLYGVQPADPWTFGGAALLLLGVALLACWLPARRAANVDPMEALRCE
jgi:putative ABC transport system permease protein